MTTIVTRFRIILLSSAMIGLGFIAYSVAKAQNIPIDASLLIGIFSLCPQSILWIDERINRKNKNIVDLELEFQREIQSMKDEHNSLYRTHVQTLEERNSRQDDAIGQALGLASQAEIKATQAVNIQKLGDKVSILSNRLTKQEEKLNQLEQKNIIITKTLLKVVARNEENIK